MAFPTDVLDDIARGKDYYSGLNAENIANLKRGCSNCTVKNYKCLKRLLRSLDYKVELDEYDDIAKELVKDMLIIIGDYTIKTPPTVNAGADQVVPIDEEAIFNANIILGSGTLASILWTQISGTPATLSGIDTSTLTVSDFVVGDMVFKVVVTDSNGLKASDTVMLTGEAVIVTTRVYYLFQDTTVLPSEATILASSFVNVIPDSDYIVPVNSGLVKYVLVFERQAEPQKGSWQDTVDSDNNGLIELSGTWNADMPFVGDFRGYITSFKTQFDNPVQFIKAPPQP